jgi:uncharacterized protein (TIGR02391 family)
MHNAIQKLERRLKDLDSLDPTSTTERDDPRFNAVELRIDDTLAEIFGRDSDEYYRYKVNSLGKMPVRTRAHLRTYGTSLLEIQQRRRKGIERARTNLQTAVYLLREKLEQAEEAAGLPTSTDWHPAIEVAVARRFNNGHYADAVEAACKALNTLVQENSRQRDLSGVPLMQKVFSPTNPILRFNELTTETEKSEQQGMMFLYAGAMGAFRNPRAHELIEDHPQTAHEMISLVNFLAKALGKTTLVTGEGKR